MANAPAVTIGLASNVGKYKMSLPVGQLLLRGFMSGVYIAVGAGLCTVCGTAAAQYLGAGIGKLIGGAVFPVGLIATVLTGMELFTGDAMLGPLAAFFGKTSWGSVLRNWFFVYIGNLIGSLAYAYLMVMGPFTQGNFATAEPNAFALNAVSIAVGKTLAYKSVGGIGLWSCFLNGIGCNFLVNLAILLGITAKDFIGKFFGIWFPIMTFVATGFEHCVANMYFLPAGLWVYQSFPGIATKMVDGKPWNPLLSKFGGLTWGDVWFWNIIPATLGNIVGGMIFIGLVYYLCYRNELPEEYRAGHQASPGATVGK
ncbi:formate/nitrite family of transporters [Pelotomaculum thermopropionicum SI]|uniref:Formate/nitrite family of transporters n=1 Tax=Pelotomaculum thermopropionicum (strain DSM 13744 / JCM 10971 / SI) TaxID=370438 RepID=A5CYV0_PELTS|nr:formate/nitrite family of transporters [Pelotomaculum thermopropionicum SI]